MEGYYEKKKELTRINSAYKHLLLGKDFFNKQEKY